MESQSKVEKTVFDKAMEGSVNAADFKLFISEFIRDQNALNLKSVECSLSKTNIDWNLDGKPCPVVDFDSNSCVTDSVTIFNNSKNKKVYFDVTYVQNPKFDMKISPEAGEIKKGGNMEIGFKCKAFCTTKVYQMLKFSFYSKNPKKIKPPKAGKGTIRGKNDQELGQLYLSFKVESELSNSIDFDELEMGTLLAKGGYGTVYKATWRGSEVAVKMLNTQELVDEEREMVRREIKLMSKLNQAFIVTYMGATQIKGQPLCLIMEYINGGTLSDLIQNPLSDHFKCKLCLDVAKGMAFLHAHNIFHRDIKPDNMLVVAAHPDSHVNLKITDFGTSRASTSYKNADPAYQSFNAMANPKKEPASKDQRKMTKGVGTLIYQAPEIIQGKTDYPIDRTDIYSFAILTLEVFTQKEPYSQPPCDKWTKWEIENFVASGKRMDIPKTVPKKVAELIVKCWDQAPQIRPAFKDIVRILTEILDTLPKGNGSPTPSDSTPKNSAIPIPPGNLGLIGWAGDIGRGEAEVKLRTTPDGTFLLRWSKTTASYVLSYRNKGAVQHIAYIMPGKDGKISVDKEDGKKATYDSIFDYVKAMKASEIITIPLVDSVSGQGEYAKSPNLQNA